MPRSKGVTAFAIIFVILAISTFYSSLSFLVYEGLSLLKVSAPSFGLIPFVSFTPSESSILDWFVAIAGLLASSFLFSASVGILSSKLKSLTSFKLTIILLIIYEVLVISEALRSTLADGSNFIDSYVITTAIMWILFWIYSLNFFMERSSQFHQSVSKNK